MTLLRQRFFTRSTEFFLLLVVALVAFLGFGLAELNWQLRQGSPMPASFLQAALPPVTLMILLLAIHFLLQWRIGEVEQVLLPIVGLLTAIGLIMLWRLLPAASVWQQLTHGGIPGLFMIALFSYFPTLVERIRHDWPITISLVGLGLLLATAFLGAKDETGARLSLKIGPLPAIQTSEVIKLALIIFLAWYMESEGEAAAGRASTLGWLRLPAIRYFVPGLLYVALASLALVKMSDFGAILILGFLFLIMLYAGFETRIFFTVTLIGLALSVGMGLMLAIFWKVPDVIQQRFAAFLNPWSQAPLLVNGAPTGLTIAQGPGYQIQQAVYAVIAGGITGTGIGLGTPQHVPLIYSDFIFAAIAEELGVLGALAVLACFAILLLRILRVAMLLPRQQVFERLVLVGIAAHLLTQVFVMVGGTLDLLPMTGVTVPFLSLGGMALCVNLSEIGLVLALVQRLKGTSP